MRTFLFNEGYFDEDLPLPFKEIFKASCITYLLEVKKIKVELVSKSIAEHEDVSTTMKNYDLRIKYLCKITLLFKNQDPFLEGFAFE